MSTEYEVFLRKLDAETRKDFENAVAELLEIDAAGNDIVCDGREDEARQWVVKRRRAMVSDSGIYKRHKLMIPGSGTIEGS
jgi:hypothetical protein